MAVDRDINVKQRVYHRNENGNISQKIKPAAGWKKI